MSGVRADAAHRLPKQLHDGLATGQRAGDAAGVEGVVDGDVQGVVEGRSEFLGSNGFVGRVLSQAIGLSVDVAALDAGSGDD